ncbi:hypothetical protein [Altericroceibacterium endophyticum]|uniref:Uncharacterized protein n=1 Tax=Altericroceibacterium endophyticum TaxID=1808508 RepID=A0A6I4T2Y5_9SPHN|nr:hypothetical protein [Altericroceibacterium endophyticum]MXO64672.1 hypothetical protein [Altericroceibacterium endophyticum]
MTLKFVKMSAVILVAALLSPVQAFAVEKNANNNTEKVNKNKTEREGANDLGDGANIRISKKDANVESEKDGRGSYTTRRRVVVLKGAHEGGDLDGNSANKDQNIKKEGDPDANR